ELAPQVRHVHLFGTALDPRSVTTMRRQAEPSRHDADVTGRHAKLGGDFLRRPSQPPQLAQPGDSFLVPQLGSVATIFTASVRHRNPPRETLRQSPPKSVRSTPPCR